MLSHHVGFNLLPPCIRKMRRGNRGGKRRNCHRNECKASLPHRSKDKLDQPQQSVSFCMINTRSIRNKTSEFNDFVIDNDLDIVGVCETWLHPDDDAVIAALNPGGHRFCHTPRLHKRGGGVALLYRSNLDVQVVPSSLNISTFEMTEISIVHNSLSMDVCVIYRPPSASSSLKQFIDDFSCLLDYLLFKNSSLLIAGDFNIHVKNVSPNTSLFLETLSAYDLKQHIQVPTHIHGHTLDLLITRQSDKNTVTDVMVVDGLSDHSAIICKLNLTKPPAAKSVIHTRNIKSINIVSFMEKITELSLLGNCSNSDVSESVECYNSLLRTVLDEYAPVKQRCVTVRPNTKWYCQDIANKKLQRRKLERKWLKSGLESDRKKYQNQRQLVQLSVRAAKTSYNSMLVESCTSTRQLFRVANVLLNRSKKSPLPTYANLADRFNKFFVEKIQNVRSALTNIGGFEIPLITEKTLDKLSPTTPNDIKSIIMSSPSKSSELDPIPTLL